MNILLPEFAPVVLQDQSSQARFGCKGPQAAAWLAAQGVPIPALPNTACEDVAGFDRVLRLGQSEFLIEADETRIEALSSLPRQHGVYPVLRNDLCIVLTGSSVNALLLQTCNVNFLAIDTSASPVVLTSMAGVTVIIRPKLYADVPQCLIWCDGTFGGYLWKTLQSIATELNTA
jgi:sarcosine oxidase subunit gamma